MRPVPRSISDLRKLSANRQQHGDYQRERGEGEEGKGGVNNDTDFGW